MKKELDIPNAHLLSLKVDEDGQPDIFKETLAKDINVCIRRINEELKRKGNEREEDEEYYRSILRLIRRIADHDGLEFQQKSELACQAQMLKH